MNICIPIQKKYLFFRKEAKLIFKEVIKKKEVPQNVCVDFGKVDFFSRSFIDEFLNITSNLKDKKVRVVIQNLKPRLKKMMYRVQKTKTEIQKVIV